MRARKHTKANDEWRNGAIIEVSGESEEELDENVRKVMDYLLKHGVRPDDITELPCQPER